MLREAEGGTMSELRCRLPLVAWQYGRYRSPQERLLAHGGFVLMVVVQVVRVWLDGNL